MQWPLLTALFAPPLNLLFFQEGGTKGPFGGEQIVYGVADTWGKKCPLILRGDEGPGWHKAL